MFDAALAKTGNVGPDGRATFEAKALLTATLATLLGLLLQIVAVSTNSWLLMDFPGQGLYRNSSRSYLVGAYTGLWKLCKVEVFMEPSQDGTFRETKRTECEKHNLFPTEAEIQRNKDYDQHHLDYTRTAIAFTIIAFVMTAIGHSFAFYALRRPRYIIKRLAALLHFMTAACLLVLNEVFVKMVDHEKTNMPERIPKESVTSFGYSFILSWIVFVIFVLAGMVFLLMSHKRKAEYADHEDGQEDEPMQLGRR